MTRDPVLATIVAGGRARIRLNIEVSRHILICTLFMESIESLQWRHRNEYAQGRPSLRRHGFIKSTPLEELAASPPWWWCLVDDLCFLCGFWLVTCQSDKSYIRFRGVTNWATQACTTPWNSGSLGGWVNHSVSVLWWLRLCTHQKWLPHHCKTHVRCFITFICCGCAYWSAVPHYPCPIWNFSWKFLYSASLLGGGKPQCVAVVVEAKNPSKMALISL